MSHVDDTSPELERLRAAHREIAKPDPVVLSRVRDRVLSGIDDRPAPPRRAAAERVRAEPDPWTSRRRAGPRRRRPPLRRFALAGAVASLLAAVTAVVLDVSPPSDGGTALPRVDAVAQARAALLPPKAIAHYTVALSRDPEEGRADPRFADCNAGPLEVWRATDPTRWRAVQPVSANPSCGTLDLSQGLGPVTAPRFEVSYAEGRTEMYVPGRDLVLVINDENAPADGERRAPSTAAAAASIQFFATPPDRTLGAGNRPPRDTRPFVDNRPPDLISDIEQMLAKGELRDQGEATRAGRKVRVLTGDRERGDGRSVRGRTKIEYVADAETFEPISATSTSTTQDPHATASTTAKFGDYERIPLTPDSVTLLEIDPKPGTTVIERTIEQIKNPPPERARK
jgi:hypothetical protein